ncbi:hypothetical protein ACIRP0_02150 [Streptomyces sp. NPDC101733]|uniref:hypothetical protein n=1 Tax=unclassified Streptomyces TaxID=2593676 RepID=UPI00381EB03D
MRHRRYGSLIGAAAAVTLLVGCQSEGAPALSLAGLTKTADAVPTAGAATCPLAFDIAEAAKAAGTDGDAAPGPGSPEEPGEPVATSEGGKRAEAGTPPAQNPGVLISCTFHIGREKVSVHTVATRKPQAVAPLAPVVQSASGSSSDELIAYLGQVGKAGTGEPVVTAGGNVATVRLKLDGEGDAALVVGAGASGSSSLGKEKVASLAKSLAEQLG